VYVSKNTPIRHGAGYWSNTRSKALKYNDIRDVLKIADVRDIGDLIQPDAECSTSISDDCEALWQFISGYDHLTRLPRLIEAWHERLAKERDWLLVLGNVWSICDNPSRYMDDLRLTTPFGLVADGKIPNSVMMSNAEQLCLSLLPDEFPIFRGCYSPDRNGASWSLHKEVACGFPYMHRFRRLGETPLLVEAAVQKRDVIALKLDRIEAEVITLRPDVVSVTNLPRVF